MRDRKTMPEWMIERKQQIYNRVCLILFVICMLCGAFVLGCTITWEQVNGKAIFVEGKRDFGLYAGVTNEDWLSYELTVDKEDKETVSTDIEQNNYTNDDLELFAKLIYRETGNQGWDCMLACGSVVLNRMNSDHYPDTLKGVIYQHNKRTGKYAYSVVKNSSRFNNTVPSEEAYWCAEFLLQNGSQIPANVMYQGQSRSIGSGVWKIINGEVYCFE